MEGDDELKDLYRETLLDYFHSGAHKGTLDPADLRMRGINPVCGDEIEMTANLTGDRLTAIRFSGHGCVISQASCAMLAEALEGASVEQARLLAAEFKNMMLSQGEPSLSEQLSSVTALAGVRKIATRVKCATLAWNTLLQGLNGHFNAHV